MSDGEEDTKPLLEVSFRLGQSISELKELVSACQCSICYEAMKSPVMTGCSHNFCSLCVRKYLLYKPQCPSCFQEVRETDLRPNRALATSMEVYTRLFPKLESLVKELRPGFTLKPKSTNKAALKPKSPAKPTVIVPETSENIDNIENEAAGKKVPCPVCHVQILEKNVNLHLDKCLAEQNGERKPLFVQASKRLKPMSQPVFHLLKETELRKRLKEHGLDTKGDRTALVGRLRNFIVVWNSQCDMERPMTKLEMVMKVHKEEKSLKTSTKSALNSNNTSLLNFDMKTDPVIIEAKQKEYVEKNKSHFAMLIEKAKKTKQAKSVEASKNEELPFSTIKLDPQPSCSGIINKNSAKTDITSEISSLVITPQKRRAGIIDIATLDEDDLIGPSPVKRAKNSLLESKKANCPVCNNSIPESLIQKHVDRCLDNPPSTRSKAKRSSHSMESNANCSEDEMDTDLLNATPDIIIHDNEVICSTPKMLNDDPSKNQPRKLRARRKGNASPVL